MDLPKFCSMLQQKKVYFSNPSEFSDKQEGKVIDSFEISFQKITKAVSSMFNTLYRNLDKLHFDDEKSKYRYIANLSSLFASKAGYENREYFEKYIYNLERLLVFSDQNAIYELGNLEFKIISENLHKILPVLIVKPISVFCWHENSVESESMWRIYANKGIAIKSTPALLKSSIMIPESDESHSYISALKNVKYLKNPASIIETLFNYNDNIEIPLSENLDPRHIIGKEIYKSYLLKNSAYIHENEVRYIIQESTKNDSYKNNEGPVFKGKYISANLEEMITEVVISPYTDNWFKDVVENLIKKEGFTFRVENSILQQ